MIGAHFPQYPYSFWICEKWLLITPTNYQQTNVEWWIELNVLQLEILVKAEYKRQNFWPSRSCREPPTTDVWWLFLKSLRANSYLGYIWVRSEKQSFLEKKELNDGNHGQGTHCAKKKRVLIVWTKIPQIPQNLFDWSS